MLIGALGLTGVLVVVAVLLAIVFAGLLFFWRAKFGGEPKEPQDLRLL